METSRGGTCSVRIRGGVDGMCAHARVCARRPIARTHTHSHTDGNVHEVIEQPSLMSYTFNVEEKQNPSSCILTLNFYFTVAYRLSFYNGRINHLESTISCEVLPNPGF